MKRVLLYSAIFLSVLEMKQISAQNAGKPVREVSSPQTRAQAMVSKVYSACSPAGYQASKVNYAFIDFYSHSDDLAIQPRPDPAAFELKQKMLKEKLNERLQAILSPEQMRQWTAYKEKEHIDW